MAGHRVHPLRGRAWAGVLAASCLALAMAGPGRADPLSATPSGPAVGSGAVPWSALVLEGSRWPARAVTRLTLTPLAAAEARGALVHSPRGSALAVPEGGAWRLDSLREVHLPLTADRELGRRVWLTADGAVLQRVRSRYGEEASEKTYRFTREGVYRVKREPADRSESDLPPPRWSRVTDTFYGYPEGVQGCARVTESSALLYLLSAMETGGTALQGEQCVFGRKHLHRVRLRPRGERDLKVDYRRRSAGGPEGAWERVRGRVTAVQVAVGLADGGGGHDDDFRFLGLEGEVRVALDRRSGLPLEVAGVIPGFGRATFHLREATLAGAR
jgi:hypothetical protein